ncbi:MAG: hypothetical protein HC820_05145 [Hydrococcus sp. RM1_1_31]|nr:hypothetical protein [Hydrococcus sp. RM1_1_31]
MPSASVPRAYIYLVTGTLPADLPQKDLRIQFETYTNLSPALTNWLKRAMAPSLEKRFQSAKEALEALEKPQFTLFGRVRLRIDREKISLDKELFGFKYPSRPSPRKAISKIQRTKLSFTKDSDAIALNFLQP